MYAVMTQSEAREVILAHLRSKDSGKATDFDLIDEVGGDEGLYQRVRQELILGDLAEDYKDVGLKYIGPPADPSTSTDLNTSLGEEAPVSNPEAPEIGRAHV